MKNGWYGPLLPQNMMHGAISMCSSKAELYINYKIEFSTVAVATLCKADV